MGAFRRIIQPVGVISGVRFLCHRQPPGVVGDAGPAKGSGETERKNLFERAETKTETKTATEAKADASA